MMQQANPSAACQQQQPARVSVNAKFSAFDDWKDRVYLSSVCPMPPDQPPQFEDMSALEPEFNPEVHLCIEPASKVTLLDFTEAHVTPAVKGNAQSSLAYTEAFRVLSDEGVRVVRQIIERNTKYLRTSERQPTYLRGLAYTSKFIRALNEHPRILELVSKYAGQPLVPHYLPMNYAHTNVGRLPKPDQGPNTVPVDHWHADSVPFVLIIILSDLTDMVGGELECVKRRGKEAGFALIEATKNNVDPKDLLQVSYQKQGYALFMQGTEIVHHVKPVQKAREPRITLVNSYMPANAFAQDRTVYATFIDVGKEKEAILEFARGRAWRASNQLDALITQQPYTENAAMLIDHLSRVIAELQMTVDLLAGRVNDTQAYYRETDDTKEASMKGM